MRSKEVEEAIKNCNLLLVGDITLHIIDDDGGTAYAGTVNKQYNEDLKTVLNYISELEKENTDAKEYADDVWRKQEELRAENEKLQDELIEEKQFNVKCLKLRVLFSDCATATSASGAIFPTTAVCADGTVTASNDVPAE